MKLLAKVSSCHKKDTRVQFATILLSLARSRKRKAQGARKKRWQVNAILGRSFSKPNEKTAQERERGSGMVWGGYII
jgi:hypothetical protein